MHELGRNFDVVRGGTFYNCDIFFYRDQNLQLNPNVNVSNNIFYNFRGFADIKNDLYQFI